MRQIVFIHGGEVYQDEGAYIDSLKSSKVSFDQRDPNWKSSLQESLGADFFLAKVSLPQRNNAKYIHWKIIFEKYLEIIDPDSIIIAYSLGSSFLIKYLIENDNLKLKNVLFLAPAITTDDLFDFKTGKEDLSKLNLQISNSLIYHSKDDHIVPFQESLILHENLQNSILKAFEDCGHFYSLEYFPQIVSDIKNWDRLFDK